jgi:hypothetical protein
MKFIKNFSSLLTSTSSKLSYYHQLDSSTLSSTIALDNNKYEKSTERIKAANRKNLIFIILSHLFVVYQHQQAAQANRVLCLHTALNNQQE